jgi:hypothetical protein
MIIQSLSDAAPIGTFNPTPTVIDAVVVVLSGESFVALAEGLQNALWTLGGVSLTGNTGHGWTCGLPGPVAIDTRQSQVGIPKKGLHRPRVSIIIPNITAAGSHPDCRAIISAMPCSCGIFLGTPITLSARLLLAGCSGQTSCQRIARAF